jgi:hypothetical protein
MEMAAILNTFNSYNGQTYITLNTVGFFNKANKQHLEQSYYNKCIQHSYWNSVVLINDTAQLPEQ